MKQQLNCFYCNRVIYRTPSEIRKNKSGRFYCSQSCAAKVNNKVPKRMRSGVCKICQTPIFNCLTYCNVCYTQKHYLATKTIAEATASRKDANRYTSIRQNARAIYFKSDRPKHCTVCRYERHIEICHIKDIADFPLDTVIQVVNDLDNLVALCPTHHWEFDHELIAPMSLHSN